MENLFEELIFTLENIEHPAQEIDSKIAEVVQQCRCKAILHRPIHHLSGGEKQKAALAVLFAMNPRVYLLDEPFASIDLYREENWLGQSFERGWIFLNHCSQLTR